MVAFATTTRYPTLGQPTPNPHDVVRSDLALRTICGLVGGNWRTVVVDGGSPPSFQETLRNWGAYVENEVPGTMGAGRRQAMAAAQRLAGPDGVVGWFEPEKLGLVPLVRELIAPILRGEADLVIPRRDPELFQRYYPPVQVEAELEGNAFVAELLGFDWDLWFGPRIWGPRAIGHMLDYDGEYGDRWDSIFVPVIRAMADTELRIISVVVNYRHPPEQTEVERDDPKMTGRRFEDQLGSLKHAIGAEVKRLGIAGMYA